MVLLDATQKNLVTLVPFNPHQAPIARLALFCTTPPPAASASGQAQQPQTTRQYVLLSASHDASLVAHELRIAARPDRLVVTLRVCAKFQMHNLSTSVRFDKLELLCANVHT